MIVQVAKTTDTDGSALRVGYTASKRVGNAVKRSRAKRRLREVVRRTLRDKGQRGHDYVVIARTAMLSASFDQLIRDFSWCLRRLNSVKEHNRGGKNPDQEPM